MTKPTIDEIRPLIIKHWNQFNSDGRFMLARMKEAHPEDYAKIKAYQGDSNSVVSGLIQNMKSKKLIPPVAVSTSALAVVSTKPSLEEIKAAVEFLMINNPKLAKGFNRAIVRDQYPEIWTKFMAYYGNKFQPIYSLFNNRRAKTRKLEKASRIETRERDPEMTPAPAMAMNFCPHCAFPIGSIIKAANAMASLGR